MSAPHVISKPDVDSIMSAWQQYHKSEAINIILSTLQRYRNSDRELPAIHLLVHDDQHEDWLIGTLFAVAPHIVLFTSNARSFAEFGGFLMRHKDNFTVESFGQDIKCRGQFTIQPSNKSDDPMAVLINREGKEEPYSISMQTWKITSPWIDRWLP